MIIQGEVSPDNQLIMFAAQNVVERRPIPGASKESSRLWLKNGHGIDLERMADGTVTLTVIRRALNLEYRTDASTKATPDGTATIHDVDTSEILRVLGLLKAMPPYMHRDFRLNSIGQIMTWAHKTGNFFFTGDNLRHTQLSWAAHAYNTFGPAGSFFVTGTIVTAGERRRYTIRRAWFELGHSHTHGDRIPKLKIENASGFQEFHRVQAAKDQASRLAQHERDKYQFAPDKSAQSPFAIPAK